MLNLYDFFSFKDYLLGFFVLVILVFVSNKQKSRVQIDDQKYFRYNLIIKLSLSFLYALYYYYIVGGGDTIAYWNGSVSMNNLFGFSPSMYFEELFNEPTREMNWRHFNRITGYPPGWIYREPESWFVSKVMSIISFVSFKSYIGGTFILGFISAMASWRLYDLVKKIGLHVDKRAAIAVFFIPSVSFWCSGVTKDTLVLMSVIFIICNIFDFRYNKSKSRLKSVFNILIYSFLLYNIRDFMLFAIIIPFVFMLSARLSNKYRSNRFVFYSIRFVTFSSALLLFFTQSSRLEESKQLEQAVVIQQDMMNNETYDGARYSIGIENFSPSGMILAFPNATIAGIYRPFIWEALSPTLFFNGLEGLFFLYLTYLFFKNRFFQKATFIKKQEFLIFAFVFSIILAYMAGLTSGLLGVLVRFKAPVIPFLLLVLTIDEDKLSLSDG